MHSILLTGMLTGLPVVITNLCLTTSGLMWWLGLPLVEIVVIIAFIVAVLVFSSPSLCLPMLSVFSCDSMRCLETSDYRSQCMSLWMQAVRIFAFLHSAAEGLSLKPDLKLAPSDKLRMQSFSLQLRIRQAVCKCAMHQAGAASLD